MPSWDAFFLAMARQVAVKSKDRSTKIGVVAVGSGHEVLAIGFNGFPRGIRDDVDARHERPAKYSWTEHAERNTIYNAARTGTSLLDSTLYMSCGIPCVDCARAIIQAGVTRIVLDQQICESQLNDERWLSQWAESCQFAEEMLKEAGVVIDRALPCES